MQQVVQNLRSGVLKVDEVPAPGARAGSLLVSTHFSLISAGTERSTVAVANKSLIGKAMEKPEMVRKVLDKARKDGLVDTMKMVFARLDSPVALGYSAAGEVLEVGRGVEGFEVGDYVACAGQNYASHAEAIAVPKNLCVKIPEGVALEDASYVTLGAIAMQGVRQAQPQLGELVAVIGLGLLGQLTVQLLKASGCVVVAADMSREKIALAEAFGADMAVHTDDLEAAAAAMSHGQGVDRVIIAASTKEDGPVRMAGEIARKRGTVVLVGAVGMNIPREPYYLKELEFRMSTSYGPGRYDKAYEEKGNDYPYGYVRWTENRNMAAFLGLIAQGKMDVRRLTTHRFDIAEAEKPYQMIMENTEPYLGIVLSYPRDTSVRKARTVELRPSRAAARVNLGVIGAGNHVKDMLLPALRKRDGVQIEAVCTGTGINARSLGDKLEARFCTTDYREVLANPAVNAVLIGTRHNAHGRMVLEALQAEKHVFVEKPLCLTMEELEAIEAVWPQAAAQGVKLMVGFNRRFSSHAGKARAFFAQRHNPLVMSYRVNAGALPADHWTQDIEVGGGRILGEACHFIDYMQSLCGARPVRVFAQSVGEHSSGITSDQTMISLRYADGSIGTVIYAAGGDSAMAKERLEVMGDGKSLTMDDYAESFFYADAKREEYKTRGRDKGFEQEMESFARGVLEPDYVGMAFEDVAAVTRTSLLAVESMKGGGVFTL